MRTVAIIQARMGSTRLPGKVMRPLPGGSVLEHVLARVRDAKRLDEAAVATTVAPEDDIIAENCGRWGVPCVRGSESDVLGRYQQAAAELRGEWIVRVTSDCPLFDGALLDRMLGTFDADYLSNGLRRTFPRGLDAEIFTIASLERAHREARHDHEREHVTPYFYQHPELFRLQSFTGEPDLSHLRWTLDTPEDWELISAIYGALHRPGRNFSTEDTLALLRERPELMKLNAGVEQKKLPSVPAAAT